LADGIESVAKEKTSSFQSSEQVGEHRKPTALDPREEYGGARPGVQSTLNFRNFQIGIDFAINPYQLLMPFQVADAFD
jgi:hypothetical protein